jgi:predicted Ser/Thr protein kinase
MNDPQKDNDESILSDDQLANLERATERGDKTLAASAGDEDIDSYQHCYSLVDSLACPIRTVLSENAAPPTLPEYGDLQEIGRGGMGIVYRGLHKQTRRADAIKVIRPDHVSSVAGVRGRELQHQLRQEAQLAARVAHEHIVPVYQVGEVDSCPWFSMQLVDGKSLRDLTREALLSPEKAAQAIERIARAVDKVHRHGILHGDIKPHNILIEAEGERPLITDFGLADVIETAEVAIGIAGTPAYMAPELADAALRQKSAEEVAGIRSIASDIYSLGATLWFALTGKPPCDENLTAKQQLQSVASGQLQFSGPWGTGISDELVRICHRCLLRDPEARYGTAGELADALSRWLNRPRWNQFFPGLRKLLQMVVAPVLGLGGLLVWWLLHLGASEAWIWTVILSGYPPLFLAFSLSQRDSRSDDRARRELWSIWIGHLVGSLACMMSLRILCHPDFGRAVTLFYPAWAAVSSVVFFAKSGNFWTFYRWIGAFWAVAAVLMAATPNLSPIVFGVCAALTCVLIARGDEAFQDQ